MAGGRSRCEGHELPFRLPSMDCWRGWWRGQTSRRVRRTGSLGGLYKNRPVSGDCPLDTIKELALRALDFELTIHQIFQMCMVIGQACSGYKMQVRSARCLVRRFSVAIVISDVGKAT